MKKLTLALVGIVLAFSLAGCSSVKSTVKENEESQEQEESQEESETRETRETRQSRVDRESQEEEEKEEEAPVQAAQSEGISAEGGYGEGRMGDTMKTYFFDYTVNSAYLCDEFNGYTPAEGYRLLVSDVTVKNTFYESIVMYDTDFQIQWNSSAEEDYDFPITLYTDPVSDEQLPAEYELGINKEVTGLLVFEVPEGKKDFSISYLELFDDDSEGNVFFVFFTAEEGPEA